MRLDGERESDNVDDLRGQSGGGGFGGGGFGFGGGGGGGGIGGLLLGLIASRFGCGGIVVVGIILLVLGINPLSLMGGGGSIGGSGFGPQAQVGQPQIGQPRDTIAAPGAPSPAGDASGRFVRQVLASTEDTWGKLLPAQTGTAYRDPRLVLFTGSVQSGCGGASAASGPFYCPADGKVYLDTSFFDELSQRFGAPGDFAAAYVIAHEIGHHVQNLLGISDAAQQAMSRGSRAQRNAVSVRLELQADCFAGIWAKDNATLLDPGDVDEAVKAATAIGDDRLQREAQGSVVPDSFTHGTSAQRVRWLQQGIADGTVDGCNTFKADAP